MTYVVKSVTNNLYKLKVVNQNGALLVAPATVPTVTASGVTALDNYSNTAAMVANDATTYANAVSYVNSTVANLTIAALSDVTLPSNPPDDNSTLVYNSANNKYVVRQMDLDGGSF